jgi:CBS domain-containing protein
MKVKDAMMGTPYYCQLDTNLGSAAELMWIGNCGFLPVMASDGKIVGVITDRDICIALGTRNRLAGEVTVREVMTNQLFACSPDDDVHAAMQMMKEGGVRRLPVIGGERNTCGCDLYGRFVAQGGNGRYWHPAGAIYGRSCKNMPGH